MKIAGGTPGPAAIVFKDGKVVGFDSAGDLFRYVLDPKKYAFDAENIKAVFVTDAASKKLVDAKTGYFVLGSETPEGMPHDAVGFGDKDAAEKFKTENKGNKVAAYGEVTLDDLKPKKKLLKMDTGHGHSSGH